MSDDTPSTEDIRRAWATNKDDDAAFNRWLRRVKAVVWEGGYDAGRYVKKNRAREVRAANPYQEQEDQG